MIKFEWDDEKNVLNFQKHKIWFEDAESVFYDPFERTERNKESDDEERFQIIGRSSLDKPLFVVFTIRDEDTVRIITVRPPTPHEWRSYEQRPKQKRRKAHP